MNAEPWVDAVAAIVRGTPRLSGALCRHRAELFSGRNEEDARAAVELCGSCPAREPCATWSETLRHNEIDGVIAGQKRVWISHPSLARKHTTTKENSR